MENLSLIIVYSDWTIARINNFFQNFFEVNGDIYYYRIIMKKGKDGTLEETNKTLFLINKKLLDKAIENRDVIKTANIDFRIEEYAFAGKDFPLVGYSTDYHINFPPEIPLEEIENGIKERFKMFVNLGVLKEADYSLSIPLKSRITGEHKGYCKIKFTDSVSFQTRAYIKIIIHHSVILLNHKKEPLRISVNWNKIYKVC